ncbi:MAG: hypothetical protein ACK5MD_00110 [Flavobacteriales bacterium]
MKNITTIFLLLLTLLKVSGQTTVTELNGFRIGQYRETATNEFGKPVQQDKYEDGFEYEAFIINQDTSLYMVFEYAVGHTDVIWSIQISGNNTTTDIGFKGLKLGLDKKEVQSVLGKPDKKDDMGEYGEKWSYDKTNYSVEISKSGKLSSVKITDNYSSNTPDVSKLPKFDNVVKLLTSKNNADIASILAPGIEIYYKDQTIFFAKSLKTEIETDYSKIFQTIREISNGLSKINTSDENSYEENMRLALGQNPKHVVKIKKGHAIKEIVFDYINGQYLIWEINAQ